MLQKKVKFSVNRLAEEFLKTTERNKKAPRGRFFIEESSENYSDKLNL